MGGWVSSRSLGALMELLSLGEGGFGSYQRFWGPGDECFGFYLTCVIFSARSVLYFL